MTIPPLSPFGRFSPLNNISRLISKKHTLGKIHSPVERYFSRGNISQVNVANPEILAQLEQFKTNPSSCPPWIRVTKEKDGSTSVAFDQELSWKFANPASIYNDGVVTTPFSGFHPITHEIFPPPEPKEEVTAHYSETNTIFKQSDFAKDLEPFTEADKLELDKIAKGTLNATIEAVKVEDHNELVAEKGDFLFGFLRQENSPRELTATVKIQGMNEDTEDAPKQPIFLTSTVTETSEEESEPEIGAEIPDLSLIPTPWDQSDELLLEPLSVETRAVMYLTAL